MRIRADFAEKTIVVPNDADWVRSPESGVDRLMLDRVGDEVARATSLVRYAAGSAFSRHEHGAGEEFLVLDGVFSDEYGDYETGAYVRNPPGSGHSPYSRTGCRLFVKLRQFDPQDLTRVVLDSADSSLWPDEGGPTCLELHEFGTERVRLIRLNAGERLPIEVDPGGIEILLISGSINDAGTELQAESWLRIPPNQENGIVASSASLLWVKTGHLPS